jgi:Circadian oscillating protein COP23
MKATNLTKITLISIYIAIGLVRVPIAQAQLPTVTAPQPPQVVPSSIPTPQNPPASPTAPDPTSTATASTIQVRCEALSTVVQKGERQALMFNWHTNYFGAEYTPEKRCQIVSARIQAAADLNGGTLKGLQLGSGILNNQTVICILQTGGESKCTDRNLLFTLKPENAKRSQAIIGKILTFAKNGSTTIDEGARLRSKLDADLGNWERQAFPEPKKSPIPNQNPNTGF